MGIFKYYLYVLKPILLLLPFVFTSKIFCETTNSNNKVESNFISEFEIYANNKNKSILRNYFKYEDDYQLFIQENMLYSVDTRHSKWLDIDENNALINNINAVYKIDKYRVTTVEYQLELVKRRSKYIVSRVNINPEQQWIQDKIPNWNNYDYGIQYLVKRTAIVISRINRDISISGYWTQSLGRSIIPGKLAVNVYKVGVEKHFIGNINREGIDSVIRILSNHGKQVFIPVSLEKISIDKDRVFCTLRYELFPRGYPADEANANFLEIEAVFSFVEQDPFVESILFNWYGDLPRSKVFGHQIRNDYRHQFDSIDEYNIIGSLNSIKDEEIRRELLVLGSKYNNIFGAIKSIIWDRRIKGNPIPLDEVLKYYEKFTLDTEGMFCNTSELSNAIIMVYLEHNNTDKHFHFIHDITEKPDSKYDVDIDNIPFYELNDILIEKEYKISIKQLATLIDREFVSAIKYDNNICDNQYILDKPLNADSANHEITNSNNNTDIAIDIPLYYSEGAGEWPVFAFSSALILNTNVFGINYKSVYLVISITGIYDKREDFPQRIRGCFGGGFLVKWNYVLPMFTDIVIYKVSPSNNRNILFLNIDTIRFGLGTAVPVRHLEFFIKVYPINWPLNKIDEKYNVFGTASIGLMF